MLWAVFARTQSKSPIGLLQMCELLSQKFNRNLKEKNDTIDSDIEHGQREQRHRPKEKREWEDLKIWPWRRI